MPRPQGHPAIDEPRSATTYAFLLVALVGLGMSAAPAASAAQATYVAPTGIATCVQSCSSFGVGIVGFEVPATATAVEIDLQDVLDGQGFQQPGQYNFEDADGNEMLDSDVDFCDTASRAVPANATGLTVEVYNGASEQLTVLPWVDQVCSGTAAGSVGTVAAESSNQLRPTP